MNLEKCAGFCGFGKVRWTLCLIWIWKSVLDFLFDMDLDLFLKSEFESVLDTPTI